MFKRILAMTLALLTLGAPPAARATGAIEAVALYAKYQRMFESFLEEQSRDASTGADKRQVYVGDHSTEGGTLVRHMDKNGIVARYRLTLYGEMGRVQSDYYMLDGAMCLIVLNTHYSGHITMPGCDELFTDYAKYIQDGIKWYRLDDAGRLAYRVQPPNVYTLDELEQMLEEGQPIPESEDAYLDDDYLGGIELDIPYFGYDAVRATLNQRMATRTGPNTKYTEPGTFPQSTSIRVFYQTEGNGVMWGMVEFESGGWKYRLYTGMKRINAASVPADSEDYVITWLNRAVTPRYGPGGEYAVQPDTLPEGVDVKVYFQENDYAMVDYEGGKQVVRGWVPLSALELTTGC